MSRKPTLIKQDHLSIILETLNNGASQKELSNIFNVTQPAISHFLKVNNVKQKWIVE